MFEHGGILKLILDWLQKKEKRKMVTDGDIVSIEEIQYVQKFMSYSPDFFRV